MAQWAWPKGKYEGATYGREKARQCIPPMAPLTSILVSFTSKFTSILTDITSKFANNLGLSCIVIDYFISIIFHVVIITCVCFFFGVPRIEELQDPDSSPRREEVGRRTLRGHGGFLLPFFYRASFAPVNDRNLAR